MFQRIVQITPHITSPGRVTAIAVQANQPIKKGEVLFKVDPEPFQIEVNRLEAALAGAQQAVPQLKSSLEQSVAATEKAIAQFNLAKSDLERQQELFSNEVIAEAKLDRYKRNMQAAEQTAAGAKAAEKRARQAYESNIGSDNTTVAQVKQQLGQAKYNLEESLVVRELFSITGAPGRYSKSRWRDASVGYPDGC